MLLLFWHVSKIGYPSVLWPGPDIEKMPYLRDLTYDAHLRNVQSRVGVRIKL